MCETSGEMHKSDIVVIVIIFFELLEGQVNALPPLNILEF